MMTIAFRDWLLNERGRRERTKKTLGIKETRLIRGIIRRPRRGNVYYLPSSDDDVKIRLMDGGGRSLRSPHHRMYTVGSMLKVDFVPREECNANNSAPSGHWIRIVPRPVTRSRGLIRQLLTRYGCPTTCTKAAKKNVLLPKLTA